MVEEDLNVRYFCIDQIPCSVSCKLKKLTSKNLHKLLNCLLSEISFFVLIIRQLKVNYLGLFMKKTFLIKEVHKNYTYS